MKQVEIDKQHVLQDFVNREVIYCVSTLLNEINQNHHNLSCNYEDLYALFQGPPSLGEYTCPECAHVWEDEPGDTDQYTCPKCKFDGVDDDDFEPTEYREIFEHWIVSDWLADKLAYHGEAVCKDFYGLTVWGRTCTGQRIALDGLIERIYDELHK